MTEEGDLPVSVIVPHYEDLANLRICLDLLEQQSLARGDFEIIVADNNSPAGLAAIRAVVADRAQVVLATERGAGPARNMGASVARGRCLAFTDSDCRPDRQWLEQGLGAIRDWDVVGGKVRVDVETPHDPSAVEAFELVFAFHNRDYVERKGFTVTANLFVRRETFDTAGPFRNGVSEDLEWCRRATAAGARLGYADAAVVGHPARRNWPELKRKLTRITREMYQLSSERPYGRALWIGRCFLVLLSSFPHLVKVVASRQLKRPRDRLGAAAILFASRLFRFVEGFRVLRAG